MSNSPARMRNALEMSPLELRIHMAAAWLFRRFPSFATRARNAGDIADYMIWQDRNLTGTPKLLPTREDLWSRMQSRLDPNRRLFVLEFGVAWGYATEMWVKALGSRNFEWHGFDRFTGLPRGWRDLPEGAFDAAGRPPAIDDSRITWHVGDVEETLDEVNLHDSRDAQWLVLFDLDIYEPTAEAWRVVGPLLQAGDLMYFDEAMDSDERRVLDEMVLPEVSVSPIGTTTLGLALEVT